MNAYLNFLMQGEHESASYFARREEYKKKILDKISKGEEALIELPNGMHVMRQMKGQIFHVLIRRRISNISIIMVTVHMMTIQHRA